jgi:DNA mismatch endonuclease (patch repair protein)
MAAVKSKNTTPELVVRRLVHGMGFRYRLHVASLPGCPDLVFRRLRKIIIVNGCFWHMHTCGRCRIPSSRRGYWVNKLKRNATRDKKTVRALRRAGWNVFVVWECQTCLERISRLKSKISRFLGKSTQETEDVDQA